MAVFDPIHTSRHLFRTGHRRPGPLRGLIFDLTHTKKQDRYRVYLMPYHYWATFFKAGPTAQIQFSLKGSTDRTRAFFSRDMSRDLDAICYAI